MAGDTGVGGPRERGRAYGEGARDRVHRSIELYAAIFRHYTGLAWAEVRDRAGTFAEWFDDTDVQLLPEIEGIAEGAGVDAEDVLALNVRTEVMFGLDARAARAAAKECTAIGAAPPATAEDRVLVAQTWDWKPGARETCVLLAMRPAGRPAFVTLVEAGLLAKCRHERRRDRTRDERADLEQRPRDPGRPVPRDPAPGADERHASRKRSRRSPAARRALVGELPHRLARPDGITDLEVRPEVPTRLARRRRPVCHANHFVRPDRPFKDLALLDGRESPRRQASAERSVGTGPIGTREIESALRAHAGSPLAKDRSAPTATPRSLPRRTTSPWPGSSRTSPPARSTSRTAILAPHRSTPSISCRSSAEGDVGRDPRRGVRYTPTQPITRRMSRNVWFFVAPMAGVAAAVSGGVPWQLGVAVGGLVPVAILLGVHRHEPRHRIAWLLLALGVVLLAIPPLIDRLLVWTGGSNALPEATAWLALGAPVALITASTVIVRARCGGSDRTAAIDAFTVAIGIGTIAWVAVLQPTLTASALDLDTRIIYLAGGILDVCLVGAAVRLAITPRPRSASLWALVGALVAVAIGHAGAILLLTTSVTITMLGPDQLMLFGGVTAALLIGLAAVHPTMTSLTEASSDERPLGLLRLALLSAASLIAPAMIALQLLPGETGEGVGVLVDATIVMFLLVVARMWGLARAQEGSAVREKALREAGAKLATATSQDGIHRAAIDGVAALAGSDAAVRMCDSPQRPGRFVVMASSGGGDAKGARFTLTLFPVWKREQLQANTAFVVQTHESTLVSDLYLARIEQGSVFVAPLFIKDELHGLMVVATPEEMTAIGRRLAARVVVAGRAGAGVGDPHRGPAHQAERGEVRVAREQLVRRGLRDRPRYHRHLREPRLPRACSDSTRRRSRACGSPI